MSLVVTETSVTIRVDDQEVAVPEGATILDACDAAGVETPTICYGDTLTPVNVCRVCVVELDGSRALVPLLLPARRRGHGGAH